ncbi:hypothetical protein M446_5961 [Methylobacterium sp. 4-46]|uniref:hypothetical protein n=1 Tax=unclassified Methylobacterium TaxID=2615210 RepID=UPI000165CB78|nr:MULTISPECIES: hypothetical protein [Methylobacterium]ACA20241.1 hypothetical protein M446_5961 [Methylobacterium sp. 4-46]WFT79417.1 hypothetical protein QA634_30090 [Methylobacterium nodulans]
MVQVTNRARGARLFWVRGEAAPRRLAPGESAELDLLDRNDPLLRAWEAAGEIEIAGEPAPRRRARPREA